MVVVETQVSDEELVNAARAGDVQAFEQLVERHFGVVYAIGYSRLGHRETAEDLAQEVFLRAYLCLARLQQPTQLAGWLVRVTHNLASDWNRRGQRASRLLPMVAMDEMAEDTADPNGRDAREQAQCRERDQAVRDAVFQLPCEQREVVLLHYVEGLSRTEIATRLAVHPATVGRHLTKALAALGGLLEPILQECVSALAPSGRAKTSTFALIGAAAAMSESAKAAIIEAMGGRAWLSSLSSSAASHAGATGRRVGIAKSLLAALAGGGKAMMTGKGVATAAAIVLAVGGVSRFAAKKNAGAGAEAAIVRSAKNPSVQAPILPEDPAPIDIIYAMEQCRSRLQSMQCNYTLTSVFEHIVDRTTIGPGKDYTAARLQKVPRERQKDYTERVVARWAMHGDKWCVECTIENYPYTNQPSRTEKRVHDGLLLWGWNSSTGQGYIRESASGESMLDLLTPQDFIIVNDLLLTELKMENTVHTTLIGTETIGGSNCHRLEFTPGENRLDFSLWVDPRRGYGVVRKQDRVATDVVSRKIEIAELKETTGSVWIPMRGQVTSYWQHGPDAGKVMMRTEFEIDPNSIIVNRPIADSRFVMKFPDGARVWDAIAQEMYTAGKHRFPY